MLTGRGTWRTKLASRSLATALVLAGSGGAVAASLVETACSKDNPAASAPAPVVIGVSFGLTNSLATFSAPLRDAIRAAEGEINANGGVLGRSVRFDVMDDQSNEGTGPTDRIQVVMQGFANEGVAAVIGPIGSGQVVASAKILADKQIISITPSATSVQLTTLETDADRFLFRTTPADDFQGAAVIQFAATTPRGLAPDGGVVLPTAGTGSTDAGAGTIPASCKNLGLAFINNSYGVSMAQYINQKFASVVSGGVVRMLDPLPVDAVSSYQTSLDQLFKDGFVPDCLALISYTDTGVEFVKEFNNHPKHPTNNGFFFIGTDGIFTQGFIDTALTDPTDPSKGAVTTTVFGTNPDTNPLTSDYNAFKTVFSSYFPIAAGADAPAFASNAYDAAILAALAIERAGSATNRIAIRNALKEVSAPPGRPVGPADVGVALTTIRGGNDVDYKGASGSVDLQANGNVLGGFIVWEVVNDPALKKVVYRTVARFSQSDLAAAGN